MGVAVTLPTTLLDLPLTGGVREDTDARGLPTGNAVVTNWEIPRKGALCKRRGGITLETGADTGADLPAALALLSWRQELLALARDGADGHAHLFGRAPAAGEWQRGDLVPPFSVRKRTIRGQNKTTGWPVVLPFGEDEKAELWAWIAADGPGTFSVMFSVVDAATGAIITPIDRVGVINPTDLRGCRCGNDAYLVYNTNLNFVARRFDGTTLASAEYVLVAGFNARRFDACELTSTHFLVAYRDAGGGAAYVAKVHGVTCVVVAAANYAATSISIAGDNQSVSVCADPAGTIYLSIYDDFFLGIYTGGFNATTMLATFAPVLVDAVPGGSNRLASEVSTGGSAVVLISGSRTVGEPSTWRRVVSAAGVVSGAPRDVWRSLLLSRARRIRGRVYAVLGVARGATGSLLGASAALVCADSPADADAVPMQLSAVLSRGAAYPPVGSLVPISEKTGQRYLLSALRVARLDGASTIPAVDAITLEAADHEDGRWLPAEHPTSLLLSGGVSTFYDGLQVAELGFLQPPEIVSISTTPVATGLGAGTYLYGVRFEWIDAQGALHTSEFGQFFSKEIFAAGGPYSTTLVIATSAATLRDRVNRVDDPNPVMITVWRSKANGAGADGVAVLYKLSALTHELTITRRNLQFQYSVSVTEQYTDAQLIQLGFGQVATSGDVLPSVGAPPSVALCLHRNRLWLASADDDRELWYSRAFAAAEAPAFVGAFRLRLDDSPDGVVGLASLDDKLVAFTGSRIYYVVGDGPNDNGSGEPYGGPWLVSAQFGCTDGRSVVSTPAGVFYLARLGVCLLTRGLVVDYVGAPLQDTFAAYPICRRAIFDETRSLVIFLQANDDDETVWCTYDLVEKAWLVWSTNLDEVTAQTMHLGRWVWGTRDAGVLTDQADDGAVAGRDGGTWTTSVLETPWIRLGATGGHELVRSLTLHADRRTPCKLKVEVFVDYKETVVQTATFDLSGLLLEERTRLELDFAQKKCTALKLRLTDEPPGGEFLGSGLRGLELYGLTLELGSKQGPAKLPATQKGGG